MWVPKSRPSEPGTDQSYRSGGADGVLSLPAAWTHEEKFPLEIGIPGFRDSTVLVSGRTGGIGQRSQYQFQGVARAPPVIQVGHRGQNMG